MDFLFYCRQKRGGIVFLENWALSFVQTEKLLITRAQKTNIFRENMNP